MFADLFVTAMFRAFLLSKTKQEYIRISGSTTLTTGQTAFAWCSCLSQSHATSLIPESLGIKINQNPVASRFLPGLPWNLWVYILIRIKTGNIILLRDFEKDWRWHKWQTLISWYEESCSAWDTLYIFNSLIQPCVDYCSVLWACCSMRDSQKSQKLHWSCNTYHNLGSSYDSNTDERFRD